MPSLKIKVGHNIRIIRLKREMTTTKLAEKVGKNQSQISKIETGESDTSLETLESISKALHVSLSELINAEEFSLKPTTDIDRLVLLAEKLKAEDLRLIIQIAERYVSYQKGEGFRARAT